MLFSHALTWYLYIVRTADNCLYTGIATNVARRYQEHATGGPKAAKYLLAHKPVKLAFSKRIGTHSLALKVEYRFKQLSKRQKESILRRGVLRWDSETGAIRL